MAVEVIPSQFFSTRQVGDFGWMIERPEDADALFIFNDNDEQFRAFVNDSTPATDGCQDGGGNAAIRHYRCVDPPRAAGIPTGPDYLELTDAVRRVIDEALGVVKELLASGRYRRVFSSAADPGGDL